MADTERTRSSILSLFADNTSGDISPQDLRDFVVTMMRPIEVVAAASHMLASDEGIIHVTYTVTAAVTITVATAEAYAGREVVIKDAGGNASVNNITIATEAAETIDGAPTATISTDYGAVRLYSDGTNWFTK